MFIAGLSVQLYLDRMQKGTDSTTVSGSISEKLKYEKVLGVDNILYLAEEVETKDRAMADLQLQNVANSSSGVGGHSVTA